MYRGCSALHWIYIGYTLCVLVLCFSQNIAAREVAHSLFVLWGRLYWEEFIVLPFAPLTPSYMLLPYAASWRCRGLCAVPPRRTGEVGHKGRECLGGVSQGF